MLETVANYGLGKFARYCGLECQKNAWKRSNHRWECKAIASFKTKIPTIVRLTALLLFRAMSSDDDKDERLLERCRSGFYFDCEPNDRVEYFVQALRRFIRGSSYPKNLDWLEDSLLLCLIRMLEMNAHTIADSELNTLGVGFFPKASLMNHDCRPNAVALFRGGL